MNNTLSPTQNMKLAMIARIKRLRMNRDSSPTLQDWDRWNTKMQDAEAAYLKL
jgi:hypothetical protein